MEQPVEHRLHIVLKDRDNNSSYSGTLVIKNLTLPSLTADDTERNPTLEDPVGASYYVIAVVLVYGMSIIMLIASHIKRKHAKLVEDRQIHKYLQEFQTVHERSARDSYRTLKKTIIARLTRERKKTYTNLSRAILPVVAVGMPRWGSVSDDMASGGGGREANRGEFANDEFSGITNWELMRAVAGPDTHNHRPRTNSLCGRECERPLGRPRALSTIVAPIHSRLNLPRRASADAAGGVVDFREEEEGEEGEENDVEKNVRFVIPRIPRLQVEGSDEAPEAVRSTARPRPLESDAESHYPYPHPPPYQHAHHHHRGYQHQQHAGRPTCRRLEPSAAGYVPSGVGQHDIWTLNEQDEPVDEPTESQSLMDTLAVTVHPTVAASAGAPTPSPQGSRRSSSRSLSPRSRTPSPRASRSPSRSPSLRRETFDMYNRNDFETNTETEQLLQVTCL